MNKLAPHMTTTANRTFTFAANVKNAAAVAIMRILASVLSVMGQDMNILMLVSTLQKNMKNTNSLLNVVAKSEKKKRKIKSLNSYPIVK